MEAMSPDCKISNSFMQGGWIINELIINLVHKVSDIIQ